MISTFFLLSCIISAERPPVLVADVCGGLVECGIEPSICMSDTAEPTCCDEQGYFRCAADCLSRDDCGGIADCEYTCSLWLCERSCD